MYNVLLLEKDLDYGRKLINELSIYNNDLRFCSFIKSEREVSSEIYKNTDIILISNDLAMKLNKKFKNFEDKIIILNNTENDLVTNNIPQISKFESVENINKIIFNLLNKISYKERYIRNIISQELNYLGYSPKYYGTKYLCESIYIIYKNEEELSDNLEKIIYPIVAKKYRKTIQNIKCNIINATDIMICECEEQKLMKYLGYYNYVKPGPKKIIEAVLSKIKEKIQ